MNFPIHFISLNQIWTDKMKKEFADYETIKVSFGKIQEFPIEENSIYMSPANSLGYMDGGIDDVLSREMFPGVENCVKDKILEIGKQTLLGRPYFPVGGAFIVKTSETTDLISAPTMFLPRDVSKTKNAYWSFLATLCLVKKEVLRRNRYFTLVVTSLCCGYGQMTEEESVRQMKQAYLDFLDTNHIPPYQEMGDKYLILKGQDEEQLNNYDCKEIKTINIRQETI
jgi:O-acetyl-ADP-ribose deacetylase (regulator of RNase III)